MLSTIVLIIHFLVAFALILIILLQTGKGAGMGAAFGGSSQTLFGSTGKASFLTKVTIMAAVIFVFTSIGLSFIMTDTESIMDGYTPPSNTPTLPSIPPADAAGVETGELPAELGDEAMPPEDTGSASPGLDLPDLAPPPAAGDADEDGE